MKYFFKALKKNIAAEYLNIGSGAMKNFSYLMTAQVAYKIILFVTFIFIARVLGVETFGKMSYALSFTAFFMILTDFGISDYLIREIAGEKEQKGQVYVNNICALKLVLSLIALAAIVFTAFLFREARQSFIIISIFGLSMIIDSYTVFLKAVFRVFERMHYEAVSNILEAILKICLVAFAIKISRLDIYSVALLFLVASVIILIVNLVAVNLKFIRLKLNFNMALWKKLLMGGSAFSVLILFHTINFRIDIVMLSKMTDNATAGWYSVAARLVEPLLIIPANFIAAIFPLASRLVKASKESVHAMYRSSVRALVISGLLLTIVLFLGSGLFIIPVFGIEFQKSIIAVKILSIALVPVFLRFFLDVFILALNRSSAVIFKAYLAGTSVHIILNTILIPRFNLSGACIATLISEFIIVAIYLTYIKKEFI